MAKQEDIYFVIKTDDKGQASVEKLSRKGVEKLIKDLEEDYQDEELDMFLECKGDVLDLSYEENKYLIIKGEIIVPKPVTKVTKYGI